MDLSEIQRSLLWDLKQLLAARGFSGLSRKAYDRLYKRVVGKPLEAVKLFKELNQELCTQRHPKLKFDEFSIDLGPDAKVVFAFRQALGLFSRLHACVTPQVRDEQLCRAAQRVCAEPKFCTSGLALEYMREFVSKVIGETPPPVDSWPCHHGPGAVAEGKMASKHVFRSVKGTIARYVDRQAFVYEHQRSEGDLIFRKYIAPDFTRLFCLPNQPDPPMRRVPAEQLATRVVTVPKDALKVRIISCEPASSQFVQEGLKDILYKRMARFKQLNPLDQTRNQQLALAASAGRIECDTLDMSDASDHVRALHVNRVFPYDWIQALNALRSPRMRFPDGQAPEITSFAPMGSALCFPVEMLVFGAIVYAGYRLAGLSQSFQEFVSDDSWGVFGDDQIIRHTATKYILAIQRGLGIPCNVSKSCIGDVPFKEACGVDAYWGELITIVRPRVLSTKRVAAAPMVQHANRLFALGFVRTAGALAKLVRVPVSIGYGPHLAEPGLSWPRYGRVRYNAALQRFEGQVPFNKEPKPPIAQGWEALYLWFTDSRQSSHPFFRKNEDDCIPTTIWAPMCGRDAMHQVAKACNGYARTSNGPIISPGSKPRAQGTPVGDCPVERSCLSPRVPFPDVDPDYELQTLREFHQLAEHAHKDTPKQ